MELDADPDWDWRTAAGGTGEELRALWAERVDRSRAVIAARLGKGEAKALGEPHPAWGGHGRVSLRWVLVHLVEEYSRHNGHADLIRESIDGETGSEDQSPSGLAQNGADPPVHLKGRVRLPLRARERRECDVPLRRA